MAAAIKQASRSIASLHRIDQTSDAHRTLSVKVTPAASGAWVTRASCRLGHCTKAPAAARIAAACALLDRGYGRPLQTVDANNANVNYVVSDQPMTEEEWADERVTEH